MKVRCPHCGEVIAVQGLGRKSFNMPVIKVCDALQICHSVPAAAEKLGCSRALVYKVLKTNGLTAKNFNRGKVTV